MIKCQVPANKKTGLEKELVKGGSESKNKKSRNVSAFKCKVIPINVFDPLAVNETFAEKDQSKDLSQALHLVLPNRSEHPIEINIRETAKIEENLIVSSIYVEEPDGSEGYEDSESQSNDSIHEEKKPYQCLQCKSIFKTKPGLKKHTESVHEGKKYHCEKCEKTFSIKAEF